MGTIGIDVGVIGGGLLAWAVYMPTQGPPQGALAGTYGGASGSIALGVGAGANVLLGGSGRSVMLQPISVEGSVGIEVTLGVSALTLQSMHLPRRVPASPRMPTAREARDNIAWLI